MAAVKRLWDTQKKMYTRRNVQRDEHFRNERERHALSMTKEELFDVAKTISKEIYVTYKNKNNYDTFLKGTFPESKDLLNLENVQCYWFISNNNAQLCITNDKCDVSIDEFHIDPKTKSMYHYKGLFNFRAIQIWSKLVRKCSLICQGTCEWAFNDLEDEKIVKKEESCLLM